MLEILQSGPIRVKAVSYEQKLLLGSFWDRSLRVLHQISKIKNGGFNMANPNSKKFSHLNEKLAPRGFWDR